MEIPYRLDTPEAIEEAMKVNLLNMGRGYKVMLAVARKTALQIPPALENARKAVRKEFTVFKEDTVREYNVEYEKVASLDLINHFPLIEKSMPWVKDISGCENIFFFLQRFPPDVRKLCSAEPLPETLTEMYQSVIAAKRFIRWEMLSYIKSKRTSHVSIDELKQLLAAQSLFDRKNDDVLQALRTAAADNADTVLYQNALAELLFSRLPTSMEEFIRIHPQSIRQKLFSKIAKLPMTGKQRISLCGFFPSGTQRKDLVAVLRKIDSVARKTTITDETRNKLHDYIVSLIRNIGYATAIYKDLFLSKELEQMQRLYIPRKVMRSVKHYSDRIVEAYTRKETLGFYPTKDYLDLYRGSISDDCIGVSLGEEQLMVPNFFNVRIFKDSDWVGNIYMLDFAKVVMIT